MGRQVSWTLWALPAVLLLLRPYFCAASPRSGSVLRAEEAANKPHRDFDVNLEDVYASPATMAKYMNSYSFPGPVDYLSAAAASSDGAPFEFYPTLSSGSVFDNFAFSPTIKLDELAYHEPVVPSAKHSSRNKEKAWRLKEHDNEDKEGTRESSKSDVKGDEWRQPEGKRNSEESRSVEEEAMGAVRRRRPNGNSGSYFRGVPERDESSEEDGRDVSREEDDDRAATSKATSLSDRDEIAYSRGNSRRPFVRVKNSGALVSEEASSEERRRGEEASREFEARPKNGGNGGNGRNGGNGGNGGNGSNGRNGGNGGNGRNGGDSDSGENSYNGGNGRNGGNGGNGRNGGNSDSGENSYNGGNGRNGYNGGNGGNGYSGGNGDSRDNGDIFGSTRNERVGNGRRRNLGGYQNSGELPSLTAETTGSRAQEASRVRGDDNGVRDVRYNSYNGNDIDDDSLQAVNGAGLRETFAPTLTTTQRPEVSTLLQRPEVSAQLRQQPSVSALLRQQTDITALLRQQPDLSSLLRQRPEASASVKPARDSSPSGTRESNARRRPAPAYTPGSTMYRSEQDEEDSSSRDQEETTTNGYSSTSTTSEPLRFSSEEETPREESPDSAEDKVHALMRPTQTATRMRRPTSAELGDAATSSTNGAGSRGSPSTNNGQRSLSTTATTVTTNSRKRGGVGGYGAPEPPPPLPPASSLVLLGRDPTPSQDQNAAATATTGTDQRAAAATNGNGGRPRTLFHQQGFQGPYSYRFGFDTADPYNPQTRYEEKDAEGRVRGSYSFLDPKGRLQVVRYEADPKGGFRVKGSFGQYPNDGRP